MPSTPRKAVRGGFRSAKKEPLAAVVTALETLPDKLSDVQAVIRMQCMWRTRKARRVAAQMTRMYKAKINAVVNGEDTSLRVNGKRVQAWSEQSARLAMMELNGRMGDRGMVIWPKGTVEKLLLERNKYSDIITRHERAQGIVVRRS